jgi:UDP-N-acetylglucosamine transferase subunit ALG13
MIFVTVGTNEAAFDRLVQAVADLRLDEELVVQRGSSSVDCQGPLVHDFLSFEEMTGYVQRARVVVCHAGVGSVLLALSNGKRPIVVPRRKELGEAVDDHQVLFARRFADEGLVQLSEPESLAASIASASPSLPPRSEAPTALVGEIKRIVDAASGRPAAPGRRPLRPTAAPRRNG